METVGRTNLTKNEEALQNQEATLRLLKLKGRERDFLEIGRLLVECDDRRYWDALGYTSFKDYVQTALGDKGMSYSYATRYMKVYRFSNSPEAHLKDLANISFSKLCVLVENEGKGEVTPALWNRAHNLTFKQLIGSLHYKGGEATPISDNEASMHTETKRRLKELGEMLGKCAMQEYRSELYTYDVVWKDSDHAPGATHVFEVHHRGELDKALSSLSYAYRILGNPRLFLIITMAEDANRARQRVHAIHHEIEPNFAVLTREQIGRLYTNLSRVQDVMRQVKPFS